MEAVMTEQAIRNEVRRLAPFHHDVELPHGLRTHLPERSNRAVERTRLSNLVKHLWPMGCLHPATGTSRASQRC
jgi:hypothetical protein